MRKTLAILALMAFAGTAHADTFHSIPCVWFRQMQAPESFTARAMAEGEWAAQAATLLLLCGVLMQSARQSRIAEELFHGRKK